VGNRPEAIKFYNAAIEAHNDGTKNPNHLTSAYQLFSSACLMDPTFFEAWFQSGNNNSNLERYDAAIANWRCALECASTLPERAMALVNLGWRLHSLGKTQEAFEATMAGLEADPTLHLGYVNLSMINGLFNNKQAMLDAAHKAYEMHPEDLNAQVSVAFANLYNGNYAEGLRFFEARFEWRLQQFLNFPYPRWGGEPDKIVFVAADQGLGDTLCFARFVEAASHRARYLHLYIQPPLLRLFSHAFMHLPNVNLIPAPAPFPEADYWTTFMSLPYALQLTDEQIRNAPQIKPSYIRQPATWKIPDRKLHIGISWSGSPLNDINKFRNIPVEQFFDLYRVPGVMLYSLQKDERAKDMHEAGGAALVRDLTPYLSDVVDTCGILRELDLVVSCESALGHIASMTGTECIHPYSYQGRDWRLGLQGEMMLWRPNNHRVFCQRNGESWQPAFDKIVEFLRGRKQRN
jgi:hypothetical protein